MVISVACPHCKRVNQIGVERMLEELRCTFCAKLFAGHAPGGAKPAARRVEATQARTHPAPPAPVADRGPAEMPRGRRGEEGRYPRRRHDRDDDEPIRRRADRAASNSESNIGLILALCIGGVLLFGGLLAVIVYVIMPSQDHVQVVENPQVIFPAPPQPPVVAPPIEAPVPAGPAVGAVEPARPADFEQMLVDLKSDNEAQRRSAYEWLRRAKADHPRQAEVAKIMEARAPDHRAKNSNQDLFFDAYFAWATKEDNFAYLITMVRDPEFSVWANKRRHKAMETLGRLKDERAAADIAHKLESFHDREHAYKALVQLGPGAEAAVIPHLTSKDPAVRSRAARVLGEIGTRQSVAALNQATAAFPIDRELAQTAATARQAIEARVK